MQPGGHGDERYAQKTHLTEHETNLRNQIVSSQVHLNLLWDLSIHVKFSSSGDHQCSAKFKTSDIMQARLFVHFQHDSE